MSDEDLRDRMRRADPAGPLRPLPPEEARRLIASAAVELPVQRRTPVRLPVLLGAAAVVAVTAAVVVFTAGEPAPVLTPPVALPTTTQPGLGIGTGAPDTGGGQQPTTAAPSPSGTSTPVTPPAVDPSPSEAPKTTVVVLADGPPDPAVRCRAPEAVTLAERAHLAFEGTVLRIEGEVVTLQVRRTWKGEADVAELRNTGGVPVLAGLEPQVGGNYLVAAADQRVMNCGYSGPDEAGLRALYDEAFPR